jgi:general secretion pathway protein C
MPARLSAFVIWALVAATAVFWGLRLLVRAPAAPAYVVPLGDGSAARGDLTRLLGSTIVGKSSVAPVADANSRFRLLGIMAPKTSAAGAADYGVALIAVDGKMPKAYAVGARLDGDLVLQRVSLRSASIGPDQGAAAITLELPPLAPAATGKLPAGGEGSSAPAPMTPAITPQAAPQMAPPLVPRPMAVQQPVQQAPPPAATTPAQPDASAAAQ